MLYLHFNAATSIFLNSLYPEQLDRLGFNYQSAAVMVAEAVRNTPIWRPCE